MTRPEKNIDWEKVDKLLLAGCSGAEIAPHFDIIPETLYERTRDKYGVLFSHYSQEKRQKGDSLLKAKQFEKAIQGDNTQLVWLGKNRLGQKENKESQGTNEAKIDSLLQGLANETEVAALRNEIKLLKEKLKENQH